MSEDIVISPEHALEGLLALGGLNYSELLYFTSWAPDKLDVVLGSLIRQGIVQRISTVNQHLARYWLARHQRTEPRERRRQPRPSSQPATALSSERSRNAFSFPAGTSRTA